jgi:hypothetical protein
MNESTNDVPLMLVRHSQSLASQLGSRADSFGLSAIRKQSGPAITRLVMTSRHLETHLRMAASA